MDCLDSWRASGRVLDRGRTGRWEEAWSSGSAFFMQGEKVLKLTPEMNSDGKPANPERTQRFPYFLESSTEAKKSKKSALFQ